MGEIADMMLDGTLDSETGEFIDGESPGHPRTMRRRRKSGKPRGSMIKCPQCNKSVAEIGLKQHLKDKHGQR